VQFSATSYTVNEGAGTATITVTLSAPSGRSVSVVYATGGGTAVDGSDYIATSDTLNFAPGETSRTFTVTILPDTLDEPNETINLTLSAPNDAVLGTPASGPLTILDDDAPPSVQFSSGIYSVNENGGTATVTVTLSATSGQTVMVGYATGNGTATSPGDYTAASGTLTFNPGQTSKTFNVSIVNDTLDEEDETVNLTLGSPINATLGSPTSAPLTILDNDYGIFMPIVMKASP